MNNLNEDSLLSNEEQKNFEKEKERALKNLEIRKIKSDIRKIQRTGTVGGFLFGEPSFSKFLMVFIFVNCTVIELYSMWVMYVKDDISALSVLVTTVVGEAISYAIYSLKAYSGKKSEVSAQLERDKFEWEKGKNAMSCETFDVPEDEDCGNGREG